MSPRIIMLLLGALLWTGAAGADEASWLRHVGIPGSVVTDMAGDSRGLWVAGRIEGGGSGARLWLARVDRKGRIRWQKHLPPTGYQLYPRLAVAGRDIWIMAETLRPSVAALGGGSLGSSEIWLGRIGPDGALRASSRLAPFRRQTVQAAAPRSGGGLILAGLAEVGEELRSQGWLAALDHRGTIIWQRLLPEAAWLTNLHIEGPDALLVGGQAAGDDTSATWLARFDGQGQLLGSWQPPLADMSVNALLPIDASIWLAGERTGADKGARLARFDLESGLVEDHPLPGLSTLRLLLGGARELFAGGDGLVQAAPGSIESAPGWLAIPVGPAKADRLRAPLGTIERLPRLSHGELRAWTLLPLDRANAGSLLVGGGADPDRGAWFGCLRAQHPARSGTPPPTPLPEPE